MIANRIKQGRKLRRKSLRELGKAIGRSHETVRQYEEGMLDVDSNLLRQFSKALSLPIEFFLRPEYLTNAEVPDFRAHRSLSEREKGAVAAEAREAVERYLEVAMLAKVSLIEPLPRGFPYRVSDLEEVEEAAEELRAVWQLGFDPLGPLIPLLEERGIPVIELSSSPKVDACTVSFESPHGSGWVVAVRPELVGDRLRFSLGHELGHLMLNCEGIDEESAAHRFSASFLVPRVAALAELGEKRSNLALNELYTLKHRYGLSMQAWIYRAAELGIITANHSSQLRDQLDSIEGPQREPGAQIATDRPKRLLQLLDHLLAEDLVTERKAAELAGMSTIQWEERRESFYL